MIARQADTFRSLLRVATEPGHGDPPDAELLRRFVSEGDRDAFAALVRRYGPLVHGLCARVLNHRQDAEDAAQATFLVLSTKADALAPGTALAAWLYGVAHRTARKLRVANARRRVRERGAATRATSDPAAEVSVREAQAIIDEELANLPDRLRAPLVLCALDGLTRDEAARRLGWTVAAVKDRLEQARDRLRTRLTRRGLVLPAGGLSLLVLGDGATAAVPAGFIDATARAAERLALDPPTPDPLSPAVRSLLDGGLRPMAVVKLPALAGLVLAVGLAAGALSAPGAATGSAESPAPGGSKPAAPVAAPARGAAELQGTWMLTETHARGRKVVAANVWLKTPILMIVGNRVTLLTHPGSEEGTVEADPRANPKEYTFNLKKPQVGVYAADGDTLKLCYNPANGIRPTDFATPPDSDRVLCVFERVSVSKGGGLTTTPKAGSGPPAAPKSDLQKLQGTWVLEETRYDGKVVVDNRQGLIAHSKIEIDGHSFTMHLLDGGSGRLHSKLQIKESTDPKRITFDWYGGQAHGVYELDGDTFRFCYVPGAKEPPAKFGAPAGSKAVLLVYKRQPRPKDKDQPADPKVPALFEGHAAPVYSAVFSADGTTLVTADADGTIKVWDVKTGEERSTIKRFSTQVTKRGAVPVTLALAPDGRALATSHGEDVPRLWNADTGRERTVLRREPEHGLVMAFSPDGRTLAFRSSTGSVDFWDVDTEVEGQRVRAPRQVGTIEVKEKAQDRVVSCPPSLTFSPDGKTLAAVASDRTVVLRQTATGRELARIRALRVRVEPKERNEGRWPGLPTEEQLRAFGVLRPFNFDDVGLAFSPDGKTLALSGPEVTLWDARTGKKTGALARAPEGFARVAFSPDGKTLTSVSPASSAVRVLAVRELWTGEAEKGDDSVGVRVRRWELATGRETADTVIRVYDGQRRRGREPAPRPTAEYVALSPDLTVMAAAGPGNAVRVWNASAALRAVPTKEKEREPKPR